MAGKCMLCGSEGDVHKRFIPVGQNRYWDGYLCDCPQCGRYLLNDSLASDLSSPKDDRTFRLACLLAEGLRRGDPGPVGVFSGKQQPGDNTVHRYLKIWWQVDDLLARFPQPAELVDRSLVNLSRLVKHPMEAATITRGRLPFLVFSPDDAVVRMIGHMNAMGLIVMENQTPEAMDIAITLAGWERLAGMRAAGPESRQAFVAMWFDEQTEPFFSQGFVPAVKDAGYEARRVDNQERNNRIGDEIVAQIRRSRFVVADFTAGCCAKCESCDLRPTCRENVRPRGSVYFEAGLARGLGIPVIWTVRKDQIENVHFDTRQYNFIVYENPEELREKLRNRIAATIH